MQINHIASGSDGNCILVDDGHSKLVLDAGLSYNKLARKVRFSEVAGVLITHCHQDHCKAAEELARRGVDIYMSMGAWTAINPEYVVLQPTILEYDELDGQKYYHQHQIGSWFVKPFAAIHDTPEPLGFLFQSTETGAKGLYIVDSGFIQYDFKGITHFLIEANYSEPLLEAGPYDDYLKDRVRQNHFSLENLKKFLRTSDLSKTEEIYLLHLSDANSDEQQFKNEIERLTGVPVYTISDKRLFPSPS